MWGSEYGRKNKEILDSLKEMFIFIISDKGIHFLLLYLTTVCDLQSYTYGMGDCFNVSALSRQSRTLAPGNWTRGWQLLCKSCHPRYNNPAGQGNVKYNVHTSVTISPHGLHANTSGLPQGKYLTTWNYSKKKRFIKRKNHANKTHLYIHKNLAHLKEVPVLSVLSILPMWQCC